MANCAKRSIISFNRWARPYCKGINIENQQAGDGAGAIRASATNKDLFKRIKIVNWIAGT